MYELLYQYYNNYTGKIVGMLLECDIEELDEFIINMYALKERADEALTILKQAEIVDEYKKYIVEVEDW